MDDSLTGRGKAMEDLFFSQQDSALLDKMKTEMAASETRSRFGIGLRRFRSRGS